MLQYIHAIVTWEVMMLLQSFMVGPQTLQGQFSQSVFDKISLLEKSMKWQREF